MKAKYGSQRRRVRRLLLERLEDRRVLASYLDAPGAVESGGDVEADPGFAQFQSEAELESWLLKDALERYKYQFGEPTWGGWYAMRNDVLLDGAFDSQEMVATVADVSHSTTNTQVDGVDEADLVETDGNFIYLLQDGDVLIVDARLPDELTLSSTTQLDGTVSGMYLHGDRLTLVGTVYSGAYRDPMPMLDTEIMIADFWPSEIVKPSTFIQVLDVSDRTGPRTIERFELDGSYQDSRMIEDTVYLVTRSSFYLPGPETQCTERVDDLASGGVSGATDVELRSIDPWGMPIPWGGECFYETQQEYVERVRGQILEQVLPRVEMLDAEGTLIESQWLVAPTSVYLPIGKAHDSLLAVTGIDVAADDPMIVDAEALPTGGSSEVYASLDTLYVAERHWGSGTDPAATQLIKFDLGRADSDIQLVAAGRVPGTVLNQFSLDEYDGYLRIVTQEGGWRNANTDLYVLAQDGNHLKVVGSVQDLAPQERLYSVRFMGDRAFVVTFGPEGGLWTDPLFTIDLSNPTSPEVRGELEIPGFANYLQMIDEGHLLGLGRDASTLTGWAEEPQVLLYDVSDLDDPQLADRLEFGGRSDWSPAFGDHHAISYFDEYGVLAVPLNQPRWRLFVDVADNGSAERLPAWPSALWVFQVDVTAEREQIRLLGQIGHSSSVIRSLRIGDRLYSISRDSIQAHRITDPDEKLAELYLGPGARDDTFKVDLGGRNTKLDVLRNDHLSPGTASQPVIVEVGATEHGGRVAIASDGRSLVVTPPQDPYLSDSFTYTIDNGPWGFDTATVHLDLLPLVKEDSRDNRIPVIGLLDLPYDGSAQITEVHASRWQSEAVIADDGQAVLYTPAPDMEGIETLTVVIAYADRPETTEHRIYVRVLGVNDDPQARDDHFEFREWQPEYSLAVLRNDSSYPDPYEKLTIIEVGETLGNGTVEISDDGRQLIYHPGDESSRSDTFMYTISDGHGGTDTARVSIEFGDVEVERRMVSLAKRDLATRLDIPPQTIEFVSAEKVEWSDTCLGVYDPGQVCATVITPGYRIVLQQAMTQYTYHTDRSDRVLLAETETVTPVVQLRLETVGADGLPISEIEAGSSFTLNVYAEDLRVDPQGVFSAYLDILYPARAVTVDGPIVHGDGFSNAPSGGIKYPGLIDELGGFGGMDLSGGGELLVASIPLKALRAGDAHFVPAPADLIWNEVLVYGSDDRLQPGEVLFVDTELQVLEGWHNLDAPSDVNNDGSTTPQDALHLAVDLNDRGPRDLRGLVRAAVEVVRDYPDVSGEGYFTALDLLMVINGLNDVTEAGIGFVTHVPPTHTLAEVVDWQPVADLVHGDGWRAELADAALTPDKMLDASFAVMTGFDAQLTRGHRRELRLEADRDRLPSVMRDAIEPLTRGTSADQPAKLADQFDKLFRELDLHAILPQVAAHFDLSPAGTALHDRFFEELSSLKLI